MRSLVGVLIGVGLWTCGTGVFGQAQYAKIAEIPIGGAAAFDYLAIDSAAKRLYVTHGTEIVVIDTTTNQIVGRIADTPRVHGIAIVPELGRGFTTNGGENKVSIVDLKTLKTLSKVETGTNPDAITYDPSKKEIYTFNGGQKGGFNATVIDAAKGTVVATIDLGDKPETGQVDPAMGRVFVNLENKNLVGVIDTGHSHEDRGMVDPARRRADRNGHRHVDEAAVRRRRFAGDARLHHRQGRREREDLRRLRRDVVRRGLEDHLQFLR